MTIAQKIWQMFTVPQRRSAIMLIGMMLIGMMMETLGIGMVIPALALMTQSDIGAKYPVLVPWLNRLGNPDHERLVMVGMLVLVGVYAAKALYLALLSWRQAHFIYAGVQASLSQRLFTGYLRQSYLFHLQRNSAQLIRNTIGQVNDAINFIQQGFVLITEGLILFGISMLLLVVEPLGAMLVVSTIGLAGWGFNRFTRRRVLRWGEASQHHERLRLQHLQQGLGGAKDVKLLGREDDFLEQYRLHNVGSARVSQRLAVLQVLPRLWLELLAVSGLAALVFAMIEQGKPLDTLLPTLGLFAAAAFRIMPSVGRILTTVYSMRFYLPVINTLHGELQLLNAIPVGQGKASMPLEKALALNDIGFQYPTADSPTLHNITLSIPQGSSIGFVGGSGAGKSTLVDVILGLIAPTKGSVTIDGVDIQANLRGWQDQIGYVPQSIYLTDDSLRRNVAFGLPADQIDDAAVWRAIHAAQLEQFVKELPQGLDTVVGERGIRLSGGQRQRIGIARAIYHEPSVLVLDEATSSLDTATERDVMESIRALQGDKTVLIVAHRLSTVEHCDYLYHLEKGWVVREGAPAAILGNISLSAAPKEAIEASSGQQDTGQL